MAFFPIGTLVGLFRIFAGMSPRLFAAPLIVGFTFPALVLVARSGRVEGAARAAVLVWFATTGGVMLSTAIPPPGAMFATLVFPLLAVMLVGPKWGTRAALVLALLACVAGVRWSSFEAAAPSAFEQRTFHLARVGSIALVILCALAYEASKDAMRRELEKARGVADAANRAKTRLLANVSHEIRTPMNGVLGSTELLLHTDIDDRQRELATAALHSGENLLGLLDDLLDFARIEEGRLSLKELAFDAEEVVGQVIGIYRPQAEAKGLEMRWDAGGQDIRVNGDSGRFQQIVSNLVSNAIKYTDSGSVAVRLDQSRGKGGVDLALSVEDTGHGIANTDEIFDRFERGAGVVHTTAGLGLGLAITRDLVQRMGGTISVESTRGVGSHFRVQIRLQASVIAVSTQQVGTTAGLRVLVAEDNRVNRLVVGRMLELLGCTVVMVEDGQAALEEFLASEPKFDVVLMDVRMPVLDGLETTRRIRTSEVGGRVPIVAITANATPADSDECLAAGMDEFLPKPISIAGLQRVLERWSA